VTIRNRASAESTRPSSQSARSASIVILFSC
jgi:hypothetical protein